MNAAAAAHSGAGAEGAATAQGCSLGFTGTTPKLLWFSLFDKLYDESDVALLANKQNQCRSETHKRVSEDLQLFPRKKNEKKRNARHCTKTKTF